jgi:hypothetical protein
VATRSSVQAGPWSAPATWDVAPVDGDTVLVKHAVTLDSDLSGAATGYTITIWKGGVLTADPTISGGIKCNGNISGSTSGSGATGRFNVGSAGTPFPQANSFVINLNGNRYIDLTNLVCNFYAAEPVSRYVLLSGAESAGATVLEVGTDVSADPTWFVGARVRVDNINKNVDSEARTIAAIAAGAITIDSGLTAAKIAGSYIHLIQRNVRVTGSTTYAFQNGTGSVLRCELSGNSNGVNAGSGHTISGTVSGNSNGVYQGSGHTISGTVSGNSYGVNAGSGHTISGTVSGNSYGVYAGSGHTISGTVSGNSNGVIYGSGHTISGTVSGNTNGVQYGSGHTISGTVSGNTNGVQYGSGHTISGTVSGNTNGVIYGSGHTISGTLSGNSNGVYQGSGLIAATAVFNTNTNDISLVEGGVWVGYGCALNSGIQVAGYATPDSTMRNRVAIFDIGGVAGAYKAWMYGGRVVSDAATLPPGNPVSYTFKHIFEIAAGLLYTDVPVMLAAGANSFTIYLLKDANGMALTPRAELFTAGSDPLTGAAALASAIMADNTAWQTLTLSYTSPREQPAIIRLSGRNASGNFWGQVVAVRAGGGASFVINP